MTPASESAVANGVIMLRALAEKSRAVAARVEGLKSDLAGASHAAHEAQLRETITRTELTVALQEALLAAADLEAQMRRLALDTYRRTAPKAPIRRGDRAADRREDRLGSPGQALVIARSGVWRGTGRELFDLRHMAAYARRRSMPGLAPRAVFDQDFYLAANPDVGAARKSPLVHYLVAGGYEDRAPHPLFDSAWYRAQAGGAVEAAGVTPLEHYARAGQAAGFSPHPLFDLGHYLAQGPDLQAGETPIEHYVRHGWRDGLSPHPLFDTAWYAACSPDAADVPALTHYLSHGWREGRSPHPLFGPGWYVEHAPRAVEGDPLTDFIVRGAAEGLSPSPWFDLPHYVAARGAALAPGVNPLVDYLQGGAWAVVEAKPGFPTAAYLASNPELIRSRLTPLEHWARLGRR